MDMTPAVAQRPAGQLWAVIAGAALVAAGIFLATAERQAVLAAIAGAGGFALLRSARAERPYPQALVVVDAAAFALFALDRNDGLGFWQLPGPWIDVLRFNLPSAVIALLVYSAAAAMALIAGYRGLRIVEALSLIAVPFLFNVLVVVGADWHMAELGAAVTLHAALPFAVQVAIGRAITLWLLGEAMLALIVAVSLNRPPRSLRVMGLFALSGAFAAVTPLIANAAQLVTQPLLAIVFSSLCAALAQGGLWAIVYLMTGVALDWLAGRPPRWDAAWDHWRTGVVKGAIYGALFIGFILIAAFVLRIPGAPAFFSAFALGAGPVLGAALFPLAMTVVGSADGTPPFFGRLRARLPQSARARARRGRRTRARAGLRGQSRRRRRRNALSRPGGDRRALLRRRRLRLRRLRRGVRRADEAAGLAPLCARGGLGRPRRRRARLVFRYRSAACRDRQVLGLRRRQLSPQRTAARRFHHLSDLQQIRRGQPRRGRRRGAAVLGRVGRGRHQLVAGGALVLDQLRAARRAPAT